MAAAGATGSEHAAALAFARMAGDERPPQRVILPTTLVARGTGEIAP